MKKDLEPAFARPHSEDKDFIHFSQSGMTLRDYFAARAMQEHIKQAYDLEESCSGDNDFSFQHTMLVLTKESYKWADAMMKARME
jgi:hypothetical protein